MEQVYLSRYKFHPSTVESYEAKNWKHWDFSKNITVKKQQEVYSYPYLSVNRFETSIYTNTGPTSLNSATAYYYNTSVCTNL